MSVGIVVNEMLDGTDVKLNIKNIFIEFKLMYLKTLKIYSYDLH